MELVIQEFECGHCDEIYKVGEQIDILSEYKVNGVLHLKDYKCKGCGRTRTISNTVSEEK